MIPIGYSCGCTPTALPVNIPGLPGGIGLAATNAYTTLTQAITLPAVGSLVVVPNPPVVGTTAWMALGQFIVIGASATGWAHFQVNSKPSSTTVGLTFLGYPGDQAPATTLAAGSVVSPAGPWGLPAPLTVYAAGAGYSLTGAQAAVVFATTSPSLVITTPGKYLISSRAKLSQGAAAAAPVAEEVATIKLARTNNTAADLPNASSVWSCPTFTSTEDATLAEITIPTVIYTTANATDIISMFAGMTSLTNAGAYKITEATIIAVRIS